MDRNAGDASWMLRYPQHTFSSESLVGTAHCGYLHTGDAPPIVNVMADTKAYIEIAVIVLLLLSVFIATGEWPTRRKK